MSKLVQLSEEAYARLRMAKRPGESFSDVVIRRFAKGDLRRLASLSGENLRWHSKWMRKIDALDQPRNLRE